MRLIKVFALAMALALFAAHPALAQTQPARTTLSQAITSSAQTTISLTASIGAASTASAQSYYFIEEELLQIRTIGTTSTVIRGVGGTTATLHPSGVQVLFVTPSKWDPTTGDTSGQSSTYPGGLIQGRSPVGTCTRGNNAILPLVVIPPNRNDAPDRKSTRLNSSHRL